MHKTIHHYFPDLYTRLESFSDPRTGSDYSLSELLVGGLSLFLFKAGSRHAMNQDRAEGEFRKNYETVFGLRLPHMDTVEALFRQVSPDELASLKAILLGQLMAKKVLHKFKVLGTSFLIALDGAHVATYAEDYCGQCTQKTSKKGHTTYYHYVLEAKLVTSSGLSLSVCSEWIANEEEAYDKQDCELKAFGRLAQKLKGYFPRLPICIAADGLYPNQTFFDICKTYHWDFIVTFKDGNLPSIWQEISLLPPSAKQQIQHYCQSKTQKTTTTYTWINELDYGGHTLSWVQSIETHTSVNTQVLTQHRFVHLSSFSLNSQRAPEVSKAGRLRWKIENEGFNTQKNQGYGLGHKFSRVSFNALKNYYQAMQIAHIIHQLLLHSTTIAQLMAKYPKLTHKHLFKQLSAAMTFECFDAEELGRRKEKRGQIRLI